MAERMDGKSGLARSQIYIKPLPRDYHEKLRKAAAAADRSMRAQARVYIMRALDEGEND